MKAVPFPAGDPLEFLARLRASERNIAYVTDGGVTVVAWNPVRTVFRLEDIEGEGRLCIGYVGYDDGAAMIGVRTAAKDDQRVRGTCFHVYANAVAIEGRSIRVMGDARFAARVRAILNRPLPDPSHIPEPLFRARMTKQAYAKAFARVQRCIRAGEFYQLNLAQRFDAAYAGETRELFSLLARRNPAACMSYFEGGNCTLLSLSPETFVRIDGRRIVTCPIKGTRPRGVTPEHDAALRAELLASEKEQAELAMITDLLRNDVGQVARVGTVRVEEARGVQANPTVWHTHSVVSGELERGTTPVGVLMKMLPGGSVTGCPKKRAVQEIDALEPLKRGPYTGVLCMLHGSFLRSSILIRTLVATKNKLSLSVGGGIVADSKMGDEYEETLQKARAFFDLGEQKSMTWINGVPADPRDPRLVLMDPLRARGKAVFETLRTYGGKVFELEAHCKRLHASAQMLGIPLPPGCADIGRQVTLAARVCGGGNLRIKILVTKDDWLIRCAPLAVDPKLYAGVSAMFVKAERRNPLAKALPYDVCARANALAARRGHEEALLVASDGRVPEGAYSNLFWVQGGVVHTANERVLHGITRAVTLKLAKRLKLKVRYALATERDLSGADEVFLTKTSTGPLPVTRVGNAKIGSGTPGPVTRKIMNAFRSVAA